MKNIIEKIIDDLVPKNINRTWFVEYLFKYKFGNKLPRGKSFSKLRAVESLHEWGIFLEQVNWDVETLNFKHRISPFLLNQKALLTLANINNQCTFSVGSILDVIKMLEGGNRNSSVGLVKHNINFSNKGLFKGYKHHHIPLLPNAYFSMLAKRDSNGKMINLESVISNFDRTMGALDISLVNAEIKSRGASKGGRMTGHWLITKTFDGEKCYLGVFPHSNGTSDDKWIKSQLAESERVFLLMKKP
ncbi:hypothetical protein MAH1_22470 [Sessilibacter sp. MAH1]